MDCRDVDKLMETYLDRELSGEAGVELELHLRSCLHCRREFGGLIALLHAPAPVIVPTGLRERILKAVDGQLDLAEAARQQGSEAARSFDPAHDWQPAEAEDAEAQRHRGTKGYRSRRLVWALGTGAVAASLAFFAVGWLTSQWWTNSQPKNAQPPVQAKVDQPITVVISPWMLASWAQAAVMPGPAGPMVMLAQGMAEEMMVAPPVEDVPMIRIYQSPPKAAATEPASPQPPPAIQLLPLVPRYLGA